MRTLLPSLNYGLNAFIFGSTFTGVQGAPLHRLWHQPPRVGVADLPIADARQAIVIQPPNADEEDEHAMMQQFYGQKQDNDWEGIRRKENRI